MLAEFLQFTASESFIFVFMSQQKSPAGLLMTLAFLGFTCFMGMAVILLDVDLGQMLEDSVSNVVQTEVSSRVQQASINPGALRESDKALYEKAARFFSEWKKHH